MKISLDKYEGTGNPEILFDGIEVTVNPCHLPRGGTALNTPEFPEALDCLEALDLIEDTHNLVKCNAGIFPVVTLKNFPEEGIEI